MTDVLLVPIAVLAGVALGSVHMGLLRWAVKRSLDSRSLSALVLTAPLRLALPAGGLASGALFGPLALAGGLLGYVLAVQVSRRLALPAEPEDAP